MDKKEFKSTIDDIDNLTIGQAFKMITKLKIGTIAVIVPIIISTLGIAYGIGKYTQEKETAVMLESPFSMRIEVADKNYDFNNLTLMKDPSIPAPDGRVALSLREVQNEFDVVQKGLIIAKTDPDKAKSIWQIIISVSDFDNKAYANQVTNFDLGVHKGDFNFTEKFVDKDTVNRTYDDGCILEYKVDSNSRRSVPHSFKWIKNIHENK